MMSRRAESRSIAAKLTPTPMPAFAPVLRLVAAGEADAVEVSVVIVEGAVEEVVGLLLKGDADVVVE